MSQGPRSPGEASTQVAETALPGLSVDSPSGRSRSRSRTGPGFSLHAVERRLLLLVGDAAAWWVGGLLVITVLHPPRFSFATGPRSLTVATIAVLSWWLWAWVNGAYDVHVASQERTVLPVLAKAALVQTLAFVGLAFFARGFTGRTVWALWLIVALCLIATWRSVYLLVLTLPVFAKQLVFVGTDAFLVNLSKIVRDGWSRHYRVIGFLDDREGPESLPDDLVFLGSLDKLPAVVDRLDVAEVVIGQDALDSRMTLENLVECRNVGVKVTAASELYEDLLQQVPVNQIDHHWVLDLPTRAQQNRIYSAIKRLLDILLAAAGLIVFVVLLPFIALAIWLDSGRPVFYRQIRTGLHGQTFWVWKLRTMRQDAEARSQPQWATPGDQRITRVGRLLRRARLDELPQLFNILKGEMSIVGPRPERPEFVAQLEKVIPFYRTRLAVKPGLTGWAQVNEGYGSSVEDALTKLQYDLYYVKQQSLVLDTLVLFKTFSVLSRLRGR